MMATALDPLKDDQLNSLIDNINKIDLNKSQTKESDCIFLPDWLKECESPFVWHTQQKRGLGVEHVVNRCLEKLDELDKEGPEFSLRRFATLLKLLLEYHILSDKKQAWETLHRMEALIELETKQTELDPLYIKVKLSLGHVVSATRAYLLMADGEEVMAKKIVNNIIPIKIMGNNDMAGLYAMKANFFLYSGYENGENVAVDFARKALESEPGFPEWEYLLAKVLRQQRKEHVFSAEIPREELTLLESAVEKSKNSKYLVYLAQVYRECAAQAFRTYRNKPGFYQSELNNTIQSMYEKAFNYYKRALDLTPDSPSNLRRTGYGIMNLPKNIADYELALKCLLRSQEMTDSVITLHILGTFHLRQSHAKTALGYFMQTAKRGSHAGLCDMVRVKYILDPENYDPIPDLEEGLVWEIKRKNKTFILVQIAAWFLLVKRDYRKGFECFTKVLTEDPHSPHLEKFKSFFLRMYDPINLYQILANEALLLLQDREALDNSNSTTENDNNLVENTLGYVEDFLDKLSEVKPELMEITPDPTMIDQIVTTSTEIKEKEKAQKEKDRFKNNRGGQNRGHRGRGNWRDNCRGRGGHSGQDESCERRGRFSINNQRNRDSCDNSGNKEGSENCSADRSSTGQRRGAQSRRGAQFSKDLEYNWRKK